VVAYQYLVHGRRSAPRGYGTRFRWLCFPLDRRAFRELAARGELGAVRWLWSLVQAPKVYELFAWGDPMPFVRHGMARVRAALVRRMSRWLATAS
jgi:hypothetical protein